MKNMLTIPKVSIIVPIYNVELYLKQCVASILAQTLTEIEIILIDDGSTDNCPKICDQYAAFDKRVRILHQSNAGVSSARNIGIKMAIADWIMFVDPDDWLEENAVQVLYDKAMETSSEMVVSSFYYNYPYSQKRAVPYKGNAILFPAEKYRKYLLGAVLVNPSCHRDYFPNQMQYIISLCHPVSRIYKKNVLKTHHIRFLENIKCYEDTLFNLEMVAVVNSVCYIFQPLYHYRKRISSAFSTCIDERLKCFEYLSSVTYVAPQFTYIFVIEKVFTYLHMLSKRNEPKHLPQMLATQVQMELESNSLYMSAIRSLNYGSMNTIKKKFQLLLLKHRMYNILLQLSKLHYELFPVQNQFGLYP